MIRILEENENLKKKVHCYGISHIKPAVRPATLTIWA